jgi:hypothetical protein
MFNSQGTRQQISNVEHRMSNVEVRRGKCGPITGPTAAGLGRLPLFASPALSLSKGYLL